MRGGTCGQSFDPIRERADPTFKLLQRQAAVRRSGQQVPHFFGLPEDALESFRVDRGFGKPVNLDANCVNLAFERGGGPLRIIGADRRAKLGSHGFERFQQLFNLAVLAQDRDASGQVANCPYQRNDRVSGREIGEALDHARDLGAHCADLGAAHAILALLSAKLLDPGHQGAEIVLLLGRSRALMGGVKSAFAGVAAALSRASSWRRRSAISDTAALRSRVRLSWDAPRGRKSARAP